MRLSEFRWNGVVPFWLKFDVLPLFLLEMGVNDSMPTVGRFLFAAPGRPFHVTMSFFDDKDALLVSFTSMLGDELLRTDR